MTSTSESADRRNVLFLQASGLGNSILLSPTIRRLHDARPDWSIDLYVYRELFGTPYEGSDLIRRIIVQNGSLPPATLRTTSYDVSICAFPSNRWQYHVLNRFVGATRRIAHDYDVGYWSTLRFLETDLVPARPGLHDVHQNMRLLDPLDVRTTDPPDLLFHRCSADERDARAFLQQNDLAGHHLVGVHPGSGPLTWKRAPVSRFLELIEERSRNDSRILVFGGPQEQELKQDTRRLIQDELNLKACTVDRSLNTVAALISRCDLFISNDTGLSHVAAAVGAPSQITIFNGTDPERTRPWRSDAELIQLKQNQMDYPFHCTST